MSDTKIKDLPSFNLYTSNWLAGTMAMTYEEKGLYIDLLAIQWESGHLPPDDRLRRLRVKKSVLRDILERFPIGEDGLRRNPRLEEERAKQRKRREGFSRGAQATNAQRWTAKTGDTPTTPPPDALPLNDTPKPVKKDDAPKAPRKAQPIDDPYLESLKTTYPYADVGREFAKAQRWCEAQSPPVTLSRQRLVNWLNRIPPPPSVNGTKPKDQPETFFEGYKRQ
jgi:uncharacterized protein YdaU (DUF1376 family)